MKINEDLIRFYGQDLIDTLVQKNHDYGNSVQEQFEEYGLTSILIRLDDKIRRLKTLRTHNPKVIEESLKDTLKDLSGYALLGVMCLQHEENVQKAKDLEEFRPKARTVAFSYPDTPENRQKVNNFLGQGELTYKKPKYGGIDDE